MVYGKLVTPPSISSTNIPILVFPEPGCSWHLALIGVEALKQDCVLYKAPNPGGVEAEIHSKKGAKMLIVY